MKKKIWITAILIAAMTTVYGCGSKENAEESTQAESVTAETSGEEGSTTEAYEEETRREVSGSAERSTEQEETVEAVETEQTVTGKAVVDIPEGFREYLPPSGIYVSSKYPEDGSNIYILTIPLYGDFPDIEEYKRKINDSLSSQTGRTVTIKMEEYGEDTLEGCDMLKAVYTYSYDGMNFRRTEYTVNTDITTVIAYTQMDGADWTDEFEESAFSMRIE